MSMITKSRSTAITLALLAAACVVARARPVRSGSSTDAAGGNTPSAYAEPRILIEPNVLMSMDSHVSHAEYSIAAHPNDPLKLVAMGITHRDVGGRMITEIYSSDDGGQSWKGMIHPYLYDKRSADPWVGYSRRGTALAVNLVTSDDRHGMYVYRSEDGGMTWGDAIRAGSGDYERLGADHTTGRYAGRLYLAAESNCKAPDVERCSEVRLWRSEDDGRTWIGPVITGRSLGTGLNVNAINVLSDGTVAVYMKKYPHPRTDLATPTSDILLARSFDGGVTFEAMRKIGEHHFGGYATFRKWTAQVAIGTPMGLDVAADPGSESFEDRMYLVQTRNPVDAWRGRLLFSYSADRGASFAPFRELAPDERDDVTQFQPAVAVNSDGVVAVMWYDTRDAPGEDQWHVYLTASLDGGETFLPPRRLTSEPSRPFNAENIRPIPLMAHDSKEGVTTSFWSGFSGFPQGGHYMGIAADARGVFHPVWSDARRGAYQMMTSRVRVVDDVAEIAEAPENTGEPQSLFEKLTLQFDPSRVDWDRGELILPVRLKNISDETFVGPFVVEIKKLETTRPGRDGSVARVLNADNGKEGEGARFEYATGGALRDLDELPPGFVTEAVVWRVRPALLRNTNLNVTAEITGYAK